MPFLSILIADSQAKLTVLRGISEQRQEVMSHLMKGCLEEFAYERPDRQTDHIEGERRKQNTHFSPLSKSMCTLQSHKMPVSQCFEAEGIHSLIFDAHVEVTEVRENVLSESYSLAVDLSLVELLSLSIVCQGQVSRSHC